MHPPHIPRHAARRMDPRGIRRRLVTFALRHGPNGGRRHV